jgi:hypothetical protein
MVENDKASKKPNSEIGILIQIELQEREEASFE